MSASASPCGMISPEVLYTLGALKRQLGIKDATLRAARRDGLPVRYKHGRGFVLGQDFIAYVLADQPALNGNDISPAQA